ncbi:hypothetical protein C8Q76DRAFT_804152 [Earliella scabrosa]|nr:hypothetical protein C8Q76DRAFT_804152 [Earliella scabrosa]
MKNFLYVFGSTALLLLSMTAPAASACIDPAKLLVIAPVTDYVPEEFLANSCPTGRACSSDRQCGSCSCNNWRGVCQE